MTFGARSPVRVLRHRPVHRHLRGTLAFFIVFVLLLGLFSKRSAIDILDWKPTRSPELEAQNDIDDVQQMIDAQNEIRRRRGLPERDEEEIAASVGATARELAEQARRYRPGELTWRAC